MPIAGMVEVERQVLCIELCSHFSLLITISLMSRESPLLRRASPRFLPYPPRVRPVYARSRTKGLWATIHAIARPSQRAAMA